MPYCSKCGNLEREGAVFCDKCGTSMQSNKGPPSQPPLFSTGGGIYKSTQLYVSTQVLIFSLLMIGGGIMGLVMAANMPPMHSTSDPWGPANDYSFNNMVGAFGAIMIVIGIIILVVGYLKKSE